MRLEDESLSSFSFRLDDSPVSSESRLEYLEILASTLQGRDGVAR
jgi:hypothetical protein